MKYNHALIIALTCLSLPSYAHVTANPNQGTAGAYFQTSFRISHGCEGQDTTKVTVKIPSGIVSLRPQSKPGWIVDIKKQKLEKPVPAGHGKMAEEEFTEISWSGGPLSDSQYDEFGILMKLPEGAKTLWFPVTQVCVKGENLWHEIPEQGQEWHDLKSPAPFVKIIDAEPSAHSHHKH